MDLYIIRHAWAFDRDDARWPDDDLRPLTEEGKERFAKVVKALAGRGMAPQVVAASPLVRCVQTAELLAAGVPDKPKICRLDELRPGSDVEGLLHGPPAKPASTSKSPGSATPPTWTGSAPRWSAGRTR